MSEKEEYGLPGQDEASGAQNASTGVNTAGSVAEARRVLNECYWIGSRGASGDDFEVLSVALDACEDMAVQRNEAMREAVEIATWLARTFYCDVTHWRPLDTPAGVMSQIDNMLAGVRDRFVAAELALRYLRSSMVTMIDRDGMYFPNSAFDRAPPQVLTALAAAFGNTPQAAKTGRDPSSTPDASSCPGLNPESLPNNPQEGE